MSSSLGYRIGREWRVEQSQLTRRELVGAKLLARTRDGVYRLAARR